MAFHAVVSTSRGNYDGRGGRIFKMFSLYEMPIDVIRRDAVR
jgi:hypothetical protein